MGREALALSREIGALKEQGLALRSLGTALAEIGQKQRAEECWREALPVPERLGAPEAAHVSRLLDDSAAE